MIIIYALIEPKTNLVKYIGKTNNPTRRYKEYCNPLKKDGLCRYYWLKSLENKDLKPELFILDEVLETEWEFWKQFYIELYKSWGFKPRNTLVKNLKNVLLRILKKLRRPQEKLVKL